MKLLLEGKDKRKFWRKAWQASTHRKKAQKVINITPNSPDDGEQLLPGPQI